MMQYVSQASGLILIAASGWAIAHRAWLARRSDWTWRAYFSERQ